MSVLIKGMEIPKNCDECRIMVFEDTNCEAELYCGCPIVFKAHPQGVDHRPDYCPLVPVPPHGRLIDADALTKILSKVIDINASIEQRNEATDQERRCLWWFEQQIGIAPTIIPAEEGE